MHWNDVGNKWGKLSSASWSPSCGKVLAGAGIANHSPLSAPRFYVWFKHLPPAAVEVCYNKNCWNMEWTRWKSYEVIISRIPTTASMVREASSWFWLRASVTGRHNTGEVCVAVGGGSKPEDFPQSHMGTLRCQKWFVHERCRRQRTSTIMQDSHCMFQMIAVYNDIEIEICLVNLLWKFPNVMISAWYEDQVPRAALDQAASIVYYTGLTWTPLHWSSWILIGQHTLW